MNAERYRKRVIENPCAMELIKSSSAWRNFYEKATVEDWLALEEIRDEVEEKVKQALRQQHLREGLLDPSVLTRKDLGLRAKAEVYNGYDHGASNFEIQKALEKVAGPATKEERKEGEATRFLEKVMSKGFYGYLKLARLLGMPKETFTVKTWYGLYLPRLPSLINPGGKVTVMEGTFNIEDTINMNTRSVALEGVGWATIFKAKDGLNKSFIYISKDYCDVYRLRIDGNKEKQTVAAYAVRLHDTYRVLIDRVMMLSCFGGGIEVTGTAAKYAIECFFVRNYMEDMGGVCIRLGDYATDMRLQGNNLQSDGGNGITIVSGANVVVDNTAWGSLNGVLLYGSAAAMNTIVANRWDYNIYHGMMLDAGAQENLIEACNIYLNSQAASGVHDAIRIKNSFRNRIIGNRLGQSYTAEKQAYGVREEGTSDYNTIINNIVLNNVLGGILPIGANTIVKNNPGHVTEREIFEPCTYGTELTYYAASSGYRINAQNEMALIEFKVPPDFSSLVAVEIIVLAQYDVTWDYSLTSVYGAVGENYATHYATDETGSKSLTANILTAMDASSVLDALAANDIVGLEIWQRGTTTVPVFVYGVRLRYLSPD